MAIEGNDWWAIAGAAAGGLVAGIVGTKLAGSSDPVFMGIRRWYEVPSTLDMRKRAIATIWQKGDRFWLRIYPIEMPTGSYLSDEIYYLETIGSGDIPFEIEDGDLESAEIATIKADYAMKKIGMDPITEWGYPSKEKARW